MDFFNQVGTPVENVEVNAGAQVAGEEKEKRTAAKEASKADKAQKVKMFETAVQNDPSMLEKLNTRSNDVVCINTLATKRIKGLIEDPSTKGDKDNRKVIPVAGFCGYRFKNVGKQPLKYKTEEFKKDENGVYVGTVVEKVAKPGQDFMLSRKYTTILACQPEFSYVFGNGKLTSAKVRKNKGPLTLDERLSATHFQFTPDENGVEKKVHGDDVKVLIEDPTTGVILPEYEATFGYLYNAVETEKKGKTSISTQQLEANAIRMLIEEAGGLL